MPDSKDELQRFKDEASGYYLGLWNILVKEEVPKEIIVDCAINNMLSIMDQYMSAQEKIDLLTVVLNTTTNEHAISTESMQ